MPKIDLEKFICNLANKDITGLAFASRIQDALSETGYAIKNEKIVEISTNEYFRPATEVEIPHKPKFKAGDYVVSSLNPAIKYRITGTIINELGEYDYICKDISGGEFVGKSRHITASKLDEWAEIVTFE